ncbi:hypothetical protein E8E13_002928 [Curvularia kusanoi]|uniref:DUF6594 domain-containing protein n=1 Tax=Curvularia kusanoi TaxID=90978 RepID=A0A9P4TFH8_CURKU|nr:hypothetical protein E8E13_002928 [Curvularia kusanoi]
MTATNMAEPSKGYHRLADLMAKYTEAAIFRRFNDLNMMSLLSLQAELVDMQAQLREMWAEDDESHDAVEKQFSTYFQMRAKLQEYHAAILQISQIQSIPAPEQADLKFLRGWLYGIGEGDGFLKGYEAFTWQLPSEDSQRNHKALERDMMTLHKAGAEQDMFSRILSSSLIDLWAWLRSFPSPETAGTMTTAHQEPTFQKTIDPDSGILHYSEERLLRFNNILISVVSATMPILSIVALYFINTVGGRIGAMAGFTVVFALVLAIFTNARRLEIAASTAA